MPQPSLATKVHYPDSDGEPMAETDFHIEVMDYLLDALKVYYHDQSRVYVAGNLFLYYQEGNPSKRVAPDVFVVFGVENKRRRIYKLWEEKIPPAIVFELTSDSTKEVDLGSKKELYARLGVQEYVLIDVLKEHLPQPLVLYRLVEGHYEPMAVKKWDGHWRVRSEMLGLEIVVERVAEGYYRTRLYDPVNDRWLPGGPEAGLQLQEAEARTASAEALAREAQERAMQEAQARHALEEQLRALQAELNRLKQSDG